MQILDETTNAKKQSVTMQVDLTEDEQRLLVEVGLRKVLLDTIRTADSYEANDFVIIPTRFEIRKKDYEGNISFEEFSDNADAVIRVDADEVWVSTFGRVHGSLLDTIQQKIKEIKEIYESNGIVFPKEAK